MWIKSLLSRRDNKSMDQRKLSTGTNILQESIWLLLWEIERGPAWEGQGSHWDFSPTFPLPQPSPYFAHSSQECLKFSQLKAMAVDCWSAWMILQKLDLWINVVQFMDELSPLRPSLIVWWKRTSLWFSGFAIVFALDCSPSPHWKWSTSSLPSPLSGMPASLIASSRLWSKNLWKGFHCTSQIPSPTTFVPKLRIWQRWHLRG